MVFRDPRRSATQIATQAERGVGIYRRCERWHFRKRVPARFAEIDPRAAVTIALGTSCEVEARRRAAEVERQLLALWRARLAGVAGDEAERYAAAVKLAAADGFTYRTAAELAAGPFSEILARVERLEATGGLARPEERRAVLGLVDPPAVRLRDGFDLYLAETAERRVGLTPLQVRKWTVPRRRAVEELVAVVGDKPLAEIGRDDAVALRAHYRGRVERGEIQAASANKQLARLRDVLAVLGEVGRGPGAEPFAGLRLRAPPDRRRVAFTADQVRAILAPGALGGMGEEARDVLAIMAGTGAGIAEVVDAAVEDLRVDDPVPHFVISEARRLKTAHRGRRVPLLGAALEAARRRKAAGGFPRYAGRADSLSNLANRRLRAKGLLGPGQSVYSLRHRFQDALIAVEVPERLQCQMMGHKLARPRYGAGPTLKHLAEWLARADL